MRSVICQLAFFHGSDHIRLVVVTSDAAEWDWVKWLPHAGDTAVEDGAGPVRMVYGAVADFLAAQQEALALRGVASSGHGMGRSKNRSHRCRRRSSCATPARAGIGWAIAPGSAG